MTYNPYLVPGRLEVFCGPMYSGKTQTLMSRLDPLKHMNVEFLFIRPNCDVRKERTYDFKSIHVSEKQPKEILEIVKEQHELIAIDEVQFFDNSLIEVVDNLLRKGKNVIAAGLELDFRGEPFGCMPYLLTRANEIIKLKSAICRYRLNEEGNICRQIATRTQRLINGEPARYDEPIISVEGDKQNETYEPRCLEHHFVHKVL